MTDEYGIRQASRKARDWTEARDRRIRTARDDGVSLRAIAVDAGLSHTAIAKILARSCVPS